MRADLCSTEEIQSFIYKVQVETSPLSKVLTGRQRGGDKSGKPKTDNDASGHGDDKSGRRYDVTDGLRVDYGHIGVGQVLNINLCLLFKILLHCLTHLEALFIP